ncbi:hypothetical protein A2U01_0034969, partial [Trifolium medium]|nr:hypothetical protein [Trifolium medium]
NTSAQLVGKASSNSLSEIVNSILLLSASVKTIVNSLEDLKISVTGLQTLTNVIQTGLKMMEVVIFSQDNNSVLNVDTSSRQLPTNKIHEPTLVHGAEGTPLEGQKKRRLIDEEFDENVDNAIYDVCDSEDDLGLNIGAGSLVQNPVTFKKPELPIAWTQCQNSD